MKGQGCTHYSSVSFFHTCQLCIICLWYRTYTYVHCLGNSFDLHHHWIWMRKYTIMWSGIFRYLISQSFKVPKHQETRIALKRHFVPINTFSLLSSLPVSTGQELSSQLPCVITFSAVPWLCIQQTWRKPVHQSQTFIAVCAYYTYAHNLQSPQWVYVMLSFITHWNHRGVSYETSSLMEDNEDEIL